MGRVMLSVLFSSVLLISSCSTTPNIPDLDFRQEMRDFVVIISNTAKKVNPAFIIIPQNGQELISLTDNPEGPLATAYAAAIDGTGREDLYYGYTGDNTETPPSENNYMLKYLNRFKREGIEVLTTDYCSTPGNMDNSYQYNYNEGFASFAADQRNLNNIPSYPAEPWNVNTNNITDLSQVKNFLYLINSENFNSTQNFIDTLKLTNYDLIIIDLFHNETEFTKSDISSLKTKYNGGKRLVIAYMSIGEAEDYRSFYWNNSWKTGSPIWLDRENPDWAGNYKVRYWEKEWQDIILSGSSSYLGKILAAEFDGVYLDIIDGFEYFENYPGF